jgi:hypothetical protein
MSDEYPSRRGKCLEKLFQYINDRRKKRESSTTYNFGTMKPENMARLFPQAALQNLQPESGHGNSCGKDPHPYKAGQFVSRNFLLTFMTGKKVPIFGL